MQQAHVSDSNYDKVKLIVSLNPFMQAPNACVNIDSHVVHNAIIFLVMPVYLIL